MKILIIARYFAPTNQIGAIRPTKLAKYLVRMGHDVTVYAGEFEGEIEDAILKRDAAELPRVLRLKHGPFYTHIHDFSAKRDPSHGGRQAAPGPKVARAGGETPGNAAGQAEPPCAAQPPRPAALAPVPKSSALWMTIYRLMWWWLDRDYAHSYRRCIQDTERYDVIFSTWNTNCAHEIAMDMLRRGRAKRWIADFRDPVTTHFPWFQKAMVKSFCRKVYRQADGVTLVDETFKTYPDLWHGQWITLENGYDPEDLSGVPAQAPDGRVHFAYCGDLYRNWNLQDMPLFAALRQLVDEGVIPLEQIALDYAGFESRLFYAQAERQGLGCCVCDHGFIPRQAALSVAANAHILLLRLWNKQGRRGLMTGKFYEYLMHRKPIIAMVAGDGGSLMAETIRTQGLGFCVEDADGEAGRAALKEYLKQQLLRFGSGQELLFPSDGEYAARFTYSNLAKRLESVLAGEAQV